MRWFAWMFAVLVVAALNGCAAHAAPELRAEPFCPGGYELVAPGPSCEIVRSVA